MSRHREEPKKSVRIQIPLRLIAKMDHFCDAAHIKKTDLANWSLEAYFQAIEAPKDKPVEIPIHVRIGREVVQGHPNYFAEAI